MEIAALALRTGGKRSPNIPPDVSLKNPDINHLRALHEVTSEISTALDTKLITAHVPTRHHR